MAEILVVDDNQKAGKAFARIIQAETGIETLYTNDPAVALEIAKSHPLKVAVLDQRMPLKSGTALFNDLKSIEPDLHGVLFSGKSNLSDLQDAMRNKFCDFINKNDAAQLPERVRTHYLEALADITERSSRNPVRLADYRRGLSWRGPRIRLELLSMKDAVGGDVTHEDEFRTIVKVDIGGTRRDLSTTRQEVETIIEEESLSKVSSNAEFKFELVSKLKAAVEQSQRSNYKRRATHAIEKATEESITLEPDQNSDGTPVRSRHLQVAPIYRRIQLLLRTSCECCGWSHIETINAFVPTGDLSTRQVDYLSDNTRFIYDTGNISG
ncbi:response regulator [Streptomyces sp. N2A]|uniref:response regulator n=1 Tax=Streptomyces sp. N2A TaxID=3073936 RepID=UPI0028704BCB|nr:response regulator [Streptomyces sp. N2A]